MDVVLQAKQSAAYIYVCSSHAENRTQPYSNACVSPAEAVLRPVFSELCFNLESFNPAFAACLLQVRQQARRASQPHAAAS